MCKDKYGITNTEDLLFFQVEDILATPAKISRIPLTLSEIMGTALDFTHTDNNKSRSRSTALNART